MTNTRTSKANGDSKPAAAVAETKPVAAVSESQSAPTAGPKPVPGVIVFGVDENNVCRAASFAADQFDLATKAAKLMQLRAVKVQGAELTDLAGQLPVGRIYASGQGFVPAIRPSLYDQLTDLADPKPAAALPTSWDEVDVGHLVLVKEGPGDGWWEAIVVAKDNDMLTLKWRDWRGYPQVVCHRAAVALLKPTAAVNA